MVQQPDPCAPRGSDGCGSAQLVDLYENDCIFDKFDACLSPDGKAIATGTYSNNFKVLSREGAAESCLEASRDPHRKRLQTPTPVKVHPLPPSLHIFCRDPTLAAVWKALDAGTTMNCDA